MSQKQATKGQLFSSEEKSYFENSYSKKSLKINCNLMTLAMLKGVLNGKLNYNVLIF